MENNIATKNPTGGAVSSGGNSEFVKSLYEAALIGNWRAAEAAYMRFKGSSCSYSVELTKSGDRALHIAASHNHTGFVRDLVRHLPENELELANRYGQTALHVAAASGALDIAEILIHKNENLASIKDRQGMIPLATAATYREKQLIEYLYPFTHTDVNAEEGLKIVIVAIQLDMFEMARDTLMGYVFASTENTMRALQVLAQKPLPRYSTIQAQIMECLLCIMPFFPCLYRMYFQHEARRLTPALVGRLWNNILTSTNEGFPESIAIRKTSTFHDAVKTGNIEFMRQSLTRFRDLDLLSIRDEAGHSLLNVAIIHRQEEIFGLLCSIKQIRYLLVHQLDNDGNNVLHLAGRIPPQRILDRMVPGAALQMQRELLWFQEVKKITPLTLLGEKNENKETPDEIFIQEHEKLQKDGEKWMKDTANSCMVVATLITTVAFAAAFTVPGGNNQETGIPILLKGVPFTVFVISNTVGMFSSATAIMMFLSILTSRYTHEEFLYSLPKRLVFGLLSLFTSIICLVSAFTATFFLAYKEEKQPELPKLVAAFACFPVTLYVMLNFKLWTDIVRSAWTFKLMFKPSKLITFY